MRLSTAQRRIQGDKRVLVGEVLRSFGTRVSLVPEVHEAPLNVVRVGRSVVVCGHIQCSGAGTRVKMCPHMDTCAGDCQLSRGK
jgi:hypothetical protein